jgi:hypothetical protein
MVLALASKSTASAEKRVAEAGSKMRELAGGGQPFTS